MINQDQGTLGILTHLIHTHTYTHHTEESSCTFRPQKTPGWAGRDSRPWASLSPCFPGPSKCRFPQGGCDPGSLHLLRAELSQGSLGGFRSHSTRSCSAEPRDAQGHVLHAGPCGPSQVSCPPARCPAHCSQRDIPKCNLVLGPPSSPT